MQKEVSFVCFLSNNCWVLRRLPRWISFLKAPLNKNNVSNLEVPQEIRSFSGFFYLILWKFLCKKCLKNKKKWIGKWNLYATFWHQRAPMGNWCTLFDQSERALYLGYVIIGIDACHASTYRWMDVSSTKGLDILLQKNLQELVELWRQSKGLTRWRWLTVIPALWYNKPISAQAININQSDCRCNCTISRWIQQVQWDFQAGNII